MGCRNPSKSLSRCLLCSYTLLLMNVYNWSLLRHIKHCLTWTQMDHGEFAVGFLLLAGPHTNPAWLKEPWRRQYQSLPGLGTESRSGGDLRTQEVVPTVVSLWFSCVKGSRKPTLQSYCRVSVQLQDVTTISSGNGRNRFIYSSSINLACMMGQALSQALGTIHIQWQVRW